MQERLLQFIWQHQYFNTQDCRTHRGEPVKIFFPGLPNTGQGPDFLDARIGIGPQVWYGPVELHIRASDWKRHAHDGDPHYGNVVLHVVWQDDGPPDPLIPVLVLQDRVPKFLLERYAGWMENPGFVPCGRQAALPDQRIWNDWKKQLLIQRLDRRTASIASYLGRNQGHWEETLWWLIAGSYGTNSNTAALIAIAQSLPLRLLAKHAHRPDQIQALLLGQAGLLQQDHSLAGEYAFLRHKYQLTPIPPSLLLHRMRPANFPAVRLSQLASLLTAGQTWFSRLKESETLAELRKLIEIPGGAGAPSAPPSRKAISPPLNPPGPAMKEGLLINAFIPILYAYGRIHDRPLLQLRAIEWLSQLRTEKNARIAGWADLGVLAGNAAESQALLELKKYYCEPRKCLDCSVGKAVLGNPGSGQAGVVAGVQ